jgi:four helix bundle protein
LKGQNATLKGENEETFRTFEDLEVYKKAREFRKRMYAVARRLPDFKKYELGRQIRRASVSLTNNIAEGHGRYHYLEEIKFELQARGFLAEVVDDLNVCKDERYLSPTDVADLKKQAREVQRLINGYIRFLRSRKAEVSFIVRESAVDDELSNEFSDPFNF